MGAYRVVDTGEKIVIYVRIYKHIYIPVMKLVSSECKNWRETYFGVKYSDGIRDYDILVLKHILPTNYNTEEDFGIVSDALGRLGIEVFWYHDKYFTYMSGVDISVVGNWSSRMIVLPKE
jgi:hypothetical protein